MIQIYPSRNSILTLFPSRWRHNDHDGVSNHQPRGCLLNRLFGRRSKKTSKLRVTGLCAGNSPGPVNSPHKGPVTRKMFPFDDVIMLYVNWLIVNWNFGTNLSRIWINIQNFPFMKIPLKWYLQNVSHFVQGYILIARRHGPVIWMALHNEGDWWMHT